MNTRVCVVVTPPSESPLHNYPNLPINTTFLAIFALNTCAKTPSCLYLPEHIRHDTTRICLFKPFLTFLGIVILILLFLPYLSLTEPYTHISICVCIWKRITPSLDSRHPEPIFPFLKGVHFVRTAPEERLNRLNLL